MADFATRTAAIGGLPPVDISLFDPSQFTVAG
jgi:hypothetical protein